ncbi:hypothetical protein QUB75_16680 [Microcoleus sp. K1-B6]
MAVGAFEGELKEEGRRKREEGRRKREEGRREKNTSFQFPISNYN